MARPHDGHRHPSGTEEARAGRTHGVERGIHGTAGAKERDPQIHSTGSDLRGGDRQHLRRRSLLRGGHRSAARRRKPHRPGKGATAPSSRSSPGEGHTEQRDEFLGLRGPLRQTRPQPGDVGRVRPRRKAVQYVRMHSFAHDHRTTRNGVVSTVSGVTEDSCPPNFHALLLGRVAGK